MNRTGVLPASRKPLAVGLALLLIAGLGFVFSRLPAFYHLPQEAGGVADAVPSLADPRDEPRKHAGQARERELRRRFDEAVVMLHAGRYDPAVAALHRVLELSPRMAEAHVNMGYALVGLRAFALARDFFLGAIDLNARQANAYYGLAVAYEGLGALPEAMGAMRTYLHFAPPEARHRSKARAALWEWETQLGPERREAAGGTPHAGPARGAREVRP